MLPVVELSFDQTLESFQRQLRAAHEEILQAMSVSPATVLLRPALTVPLRPLRRGDD